MDYKDLKGPKNYNLVKAMIDQEMLNFRWETDPEWEIKMEKIRKMITHFWKYNLERDFDIGKMKWVEKKTS